LKILIVSILPVEKEIYWSGINAAVLRQLAKNNTIETCYSPTAHKLQKLLGMVSRIRYKLFGTRSNVYFNSYVSLIYSPTLLKKTSEYKPDLLLVLGSGSELLHFNPTCPAYLVADANFHLLRDDYSLYTTLTYNGAKNAASVEKKSLIKYDCLFYTSDWALQSTAQHYPSLTQKLRHINFGSNIPDEGLTSITIPSEKSQLSLLTVGIDYQRKGIDKSSSLVKLLGCKGTIVGTNIKIDKQTKEGIAQMVAYYKAAHFFVLLSRADCTPIVINEANSVGLPVIVSNVGGINSVVKEGVNGFIVETETDAVAIIEQFIGNSEAYTALRKSTYEYYKKSLTWSIFEKTILTTFGENRHH